MPSNSGAATWNSCRGQIRVLLRQCIPFPCGFFRTIYTANVLSLCFPMKINHKLEYLLCQSTRPDLFFLLNWRIISLQYCVGFCHLSTWIRHRQTYIPSVLSLCLTSHSTPPAPGWHRTLVWVPGVIWKIPTGCHSTQGNVHVSRPLSPSIPPSASPTVSTILFSISASPLLPCRQVHHRRMNG